jgi:hypothetical protein
VALPIRLPARARWHFALAATGLCVVCAAVLGRPDGVGTTSTSASDLTTLQPKLVGFSTQRLTSELGAKYGFRFMSSAAPADPGGVDMATARDAGGDQLRVIVFGRAPGPVHALACEFTPAHVAVGDTAPAAADFLDACARTGAGQAQGAGVARWVAQAQAGLAAVPVIRTDRDRLTAQARFAAAGYVVRRLPGTGEWIMVVTGEVP